MSVTEPTEECTLNYCTPNHPNEKHTNTRVFRGSWCHATLSCTLVTRVVLFLHMLHVFGVWIIPFTTSLHSYQNCIFHSFFFLFFTFHFLGDMFFIYHSLHKINMLCILTSYIYRIQTKIINCFSWISSPFFRWRMIRLCLCYGNDFTYIKKCQKSTVLWLY